MKTSALFCRLIACNLTICHSQSAITSVIQTAAVRHVFGFQLVISDSAIYKSGITGYTYSTALVQTFVTAYIDICHGTTLGFVNENTATAASCKIVVDSAAIHNKCAAVSAIYSAASCRKRSRTIHFFNTFVCRNRHIIKREISHVMNTAAVIGSCCFLVETACYYSRAIYGNFRAFIHF